MAEVTLWFSSLGRKKPIDLCLVQWNTLGALSHCVRNQGCNGVRQLKIHGKAMSKRSRYMERPWASAPANSPSWAQSPVILVHVPDMWVKKSPDDSSPQPFKSFQPRFQTSESRDKPSLLCSVQIPDPQNLWMWSNGCCFMPLSFRVVCCTATNNWKRLFTLLFLLFLLYYYLLLQITKRMDGKRYTKQTLIKRKVMYLDKFQTK